MKNILLIICLLIMPLQEILASPTAMPLTGIQKEVSPAVPPQSATPAIKPIKISEINANIFSAIYDFVQETGADLFEGFVSLKDFVEVGEWVIEGWQTPEMRQQIASFSLRFLIVFFVAFVLAQAISVWLKPKIHQLLNCREHPFSVKMKRLAFAALLSIIAPLVFGFLLYSLSRLLSPKDSVYLEIARILSSGAVTIWILLNLAHLFFKPPSADHKHIPLPQEVLTTCYQWMRRLAAVALFGFFALETGSLIELPESGGRLLLQGTGLLITIMAILTMLSIHHSISEWIQLRRKSHNLSSLEKAMLPYLQFSYIPLIVFIVVSYVSWVTHEFDRFQVVVWKSLFTLALFPLLRVGASCLRRIRVLYLQKHLKQFSQVFAYRATYYGRQIDFVTVSLLNIAALLFVLDLWGINPTYFIFSSFGRAVAEKSFSIFTIIVIALFVTRMGNGLLTKYLDAAKGARTDAQKQKIARFKTIYSVSRNILRIAVWTPAILLIIVELDIDIVPLIATVGILSVGLSFGVQSLVKDLVTGFFMLLEDAFAVGDLVVINGQMGRIESLTVRVVRIRATDGSLHTFPYGNITSLCNQNRDFSAAVMLFRVGLDASIDQVFEILEKITKDLRKDPTVRKYIAGNIEIDGVNELNDFAFEIRAILKTKPSEHYKVRWAFNRLLKQYFESENIPTATPRQVSYNYAVEKK
jgi:small-conductance mechanosensitive channel